MTGQNITGLLSCGTDRYRLWCSPLGRVGVICIVLTILIFGMDAADASETTVAGTAAVTGDSNTPWHISADEIHYDQTTDEYIGMGNVLITKKGRRLSADMARFNHQHMKAYAFGHVVMTVDRDTLVAERLEMDLNTETGTAITEPFFFMKVTFISKETSFIKPAKIHMPQTGQR